MSLGLDRRHSPKKNTCWRPGVRRGTPFLRRPVDVNAVNLEQPGPTMGYTHGCAPSRRTSDARGRRMPRCAGWKRGLSHWRPHAVGTPIRGHGNPSGALPDSALVDIARELRAPNSALPLSPGLTSTGADPSIQWTILASLIKSRTSGVQLARIVSTRRSGSFCAWSSCRYPKAFDPLASCTRGAFVEVHLKAARPDTIGNRVDYLRVGAERTEARSEGRRGHRVVAVRARDAAVRRPGGRPAVADGRGAGDRKRWRCRSSPRAIVARPLLRTALGLAEPPRLPRDAGKHPFIRSRPQTIALGRLQARPIELDDLGPAPRSAGPVQMRTPAEDRQPHGRLRQHGRLRSERDGGGLRCAGRTSACKRRPRPK